MARPPTWSAGVVARGSQRQLKRSLLPSDASAMHCFVHQETAAVGLCCYCAKGVCRGCARDLGCGLACSDSCATEVRISKEAGRRAHRIYGLRGKTLPAVMLTNIAMGLIFVTWGAAERNSRFGVFLVLMGLVLLSAAAISRTNRKQTGL